MKRVLYISNIEVPYRVRFFNEMAKYCDLTVLYESSGSAQRNAQWAKSEAVEHRVKYISGTGRWSAFSQMYREATSGFDQVIFGCCNSRVQMPVYMAMRLMGKPYAMNLDGETFLEGRDLRSRLKHYFLRGADVYFVAGEKSAESLRRALGDVKVIPYYFSSLSEQELAAHRETDPRQRNDTVLVVGRYIAVKGMDVALRAAEMDPARKYKFVGMGSRTELFLKEQRVPENVEIIPFLQKQELEREYRSCGMLVLPSRQECWGLVVNEAASFGLPIVSTWGSGAAVEFLAEEYPGLLAQPGDAEDLLRCIRRCAALEDREGYSRFLMEKSRHYSIERSARNCGDKPQKI